jgi:hypothetical protein
MREVMAAGTAAPLARMLGSREYSVIAAGFNQATATLLEGNFVLIESATGDGAGVRLKPATEQYVHAIINLSWFSVAVYPDGSERINGMGPGTPFIMEGGEAMFAVPARRQWIAGAGAAVTPSVINPAVAGQAAYYATDGSVLSGAGAVWFPGGDTLAVGAPMASPPPTVGSVQAQQVNIAIDPQVGSGAAPGARLNFNYYVDDAGLGRAIGNGPMANIQTHDADFAGHAGSRLALAVGDINSAGPGAPAAIDGVLNLVFGPVGGGTTHGFVVVGDGSMIPWPGPTRWSLQANQVNIAIDPQVGTGAALGARLNFNYYIDNTGTSRAIGNGPIANIQTHDTNPVTGQPGARMAIAIGDINSAGAGANIGLTGLMNLVYGGVGSGGTGAYVLIGGGADMPAITPTRNALIVSQIYAGRVDLAWQPAVTGILAARLNMNCNADINNNLHYTDNGPAYSTIGHNPTTGAHFFDCWYSPPGTAGAMCATFTQLFAFQAAPEIGASQSNFYLTNAKGGAGVTSIDQVLIGAANTGPGGVGRALYIAN